MASSALVKAKEHLMRLREHVGRIKNKGEEAVGEGIAAVEVLGGSVAGGYLDEAMGADEGDGIKVYAVQKVPVNLGLALALHGAAFMGAAGKHSGHAHSLGNGFLGSYGTNLGRSIAKKSATVGK